MKKRKKKRGRLDITFLKFSTGTHSSNLWHGKESFYRLGPQNPKKKQREFEVGREKQTMEEERELREMKRRRFVEAYLREGEGDGERERKRSVSKQKRKKRQLLKDPYTLSFWQ